MTPFTLLMKCALLQNNIKFMISSNYNTIIHFSFIILI